MPEWMLSQIIAQAPRKHTAAGEQKFGIARIEDNAKCKEAAPATPGRPLRFVYRCSARGDQTLAGDHDPLAVLAANGLDAAEARQVVARLDLHDAADAALDQRGAVVDAAHVPAIEPRQR